MEKEEGKYQRTTICNRIAEPDFLLQWGNRKRLRCVKIKEEDVSEKSDGGVTVIRKKTKSRIDRRVVRTDKDTPPPPSPYRLSNKNGDSTPIRSISGNENRKSQSCSPEKEDRYYTTRGSLLGFEDNGKMFLETAAAVEDKGLVWPRLFISLSSKEKEEDFMAMKGCKLPQRPKKRAKLIQRSLLLVSPGAWLSDLCQERYEVREKKTAKKRPRGLKAMGSMDSDSE
ncbi:hypothetical protein AQUCO_00400741v1 [Aquilegia coerulea]|uniref:DUF1639 domain-containing protein n=1 Tax=Aquilegia coerulea TaxID=218851 RepID=A0A2G5EWN1_AQUCA|nr:hypothetical protein AQUCO_00400741v1 [Aquilegia coerulea]